MWSSQFDVAAVDVRQIWIGIGDLFRSRRPHLIGINVFPFDLDFCIPVGRHSPDCKDVVVGRASVGGKKADHHHRVGKLLRREIERLRLGIRRFVFVDGRLKDRFEIDGHRMFAGRNHVLLMHVIGNEAMKERKPRTGTPEELPTPRSIGAGMIDKFGPTISI